MPMKLNVGLSKKVTDNNFGSRGASVNLELELESAVVGEPAKLQEKIRQIFAHVRSALNEELNDNGHAPNSERNGQSRSSIPNNGNGQSRSSTPANGNGQSRTSAPTNGNGGGQRQATQSQIKAIFAIAKNQGIDVSYYLNDRFRVNSPSALTIKEASNVIDELKGNTNNGNGG